MGSYVSYGKRRKTGKVSKMIFGILAIASLGLVIFMFYGYTSAITAKTDINNEIGQLNEQTTYLLSQKQLKQTTLDSLESEIAKLEAEQLSYED